MGNFISISFAKFYGGFFGSNFDGWSSTNVKGPPIGIILLGNAGVGKSFLANILLNENFFKHDCSPSSVTHVTEWKDFRANNRIYVVFNVPGLIENNQEAIDQNKQEIQRAFEQTPYSIVIPVFHGGSGGRLREEDLNTFTVLNKAYQFNQESLLFIVNDLPSNRQPLYEGETHLKLQELVNVKIPKICFFNRIDSNNQRQRTQLRKQLLDALAFCTPVKHEKHNEVVLLVDRLKEMEAEMKKKQDEIDTKIRTLNGMIELFQEIYDATKESDSCTIL